LSFARWTVVRPMRSSIISGGRARRKSLFQLFSSAWILS